MNRLWLALPWLASLVLVLLVMGRGLMPNEPPSPSQPAPENPVALKPTVPLQIELLPSPTGQENLWALRLQSLQADRDVVLRMGSDAETDQQVVWQGRLAAGRSQSLEVRFAPQGSAGSVWASLEVSGLGEATMRAVAHLPRPGVTPATSDPSQVLQDPDTGNKVIQYTGQVEEEP